MDSRTLDIIIVNWNAGDQLRDCLMSVKNADRDGFTLSQVIIVDNASVDGSLKGLESLELPLDIMRNAENVGFGAACNQGAAIGKADYLLFLNPDTRLYADSLKVPVAYMESRNNSRVGVCSIKLVNETGQADRTCTRLPKPGHFFVKIFGLDRIFPRVFRSHFMTEWDHEDSRRVEHVIGAFYLIRRNIFNELGGFDTRFFVYLEDLDLSNRVGRLGYEIHYIADAMAFHKGGGTSAQVKAKRLFYSLRSRIIYGFKHFNIFSALVHLAATLIIEPLMRMVLAVLHHSAKEMKETAQGYLMLYKDMPDIIRKLR